MQEQHSNPKISFSTRRILQAPIALFMLYESILLLAAVMIAFELYAVGHAYTMTTILSHAAGHTHIHSLAPHVVEGPPDAPIGAPIVEGPPDYPSHLFAQLFSH